MPENRLSKFGLTETGEKVTYLHRTIHQEADKLGKALIQAFDSPGELIARNAELERQMQQMIEDNLERERLAAASTSSHAERAALKERRANMESDMLAHTRGRDAHVEIIKNKGGATRN